MPTAASSFILRDYRDADEAGWVRCRALSFLGSQYYDDVKPQRTPLSRPALARVAVLTSDPSTVIGVLDVEREGHSATIDTVATHPDFQGLGVASALLEDALAALRARGVGTLDAWTREDIPANAWYQRHGFSETFRYLHVYLGEGDDEGGFVTPEGLSTPVTAFMHGRIEDEVAMRAKFARVYVCRRYLREV